jgi:hypothetical protein
MFKSWSKIVLVSMLAIVIAAPAFATTARVNTMAGTSDYLSDDSNVFRWYSTLPSYANLVQAEIGTWQGGPDALMDSRALGFNYACGDDGKWGTYRLTLLEHSVDQPGFYVVNPLMFLLSPGSIFDTVNLVPGNQYGNTPVNKWDLAGGWEIGESFVLGASYTRSSYKTELTGDTPTEEYSLSWSTYGLGLTWSNNDNMLADVAFTYGSYGGDWKDLDPTVTVEVDKGTSLDFAGRLFYDWKDYVTVVPVVEYAQAEYALKSDTDGVVPDGTAGLAHGDKVMGFKIGAGLDIEVNGSNTLVFAAEYDYRKFEYSVPDTAGTAMKEMTGSTLPVFRLALESEITSWLTTRIGAVHRNISYTEKFNNGREDKTTNDPDYTGSVGITESMSRFEWFLGCGFNVAEWTVDMELAPETPFSVGYWLTGYSAFDGLGADAGPVGRISATYGF